MKITKLAFYIPVLILICGCSGRSAGFRSVGDEDITFQAMPAERNVAGAAAGSFLFRVTPSATKFEALSVALKDSLTLSMDSAFKAVIHHRESPPVFLQSVPSGVKGTFEFMADFDMKGIKESDTIELIYRDKYINRKLYRVKTVIQ
ncbi:hypothetical protein INP83_10930 [Mucilaginibacter sp. 21P]|uniref:hypothetical protein n=1 Tax=Mucilaginibacter sp. 21P TaxID=2778902 RepID=UPI001C59FE4C|nr:hypothetical protein [Mucilaginibacter sp. 21P]QXV63631.1 hypothetical protein INP83_10930 [Mucilaginibacter sp. 21P]